MQTSSWIKPRVVVPVAVLITLAVLNWRVLAGGVTIALFALLMWYITMAIEYNTWTPFHLPKSKKKHLTAPPA